MTNPNDSWKWQPQPGGYNPPPPQTDKDKEPPTWFKVGVITALCFAALFSCVVIFAPDDEEPPVVFAPPAAEKVEGVAPAPAPPQAPVLPEAPPVVEPKTIVLPDLTGRNGKIARDHLEDLGLKEVTFSSIDTYDTWVLLPQNWTVTGIEPGVGTEVNPNSTVIVYVTKNN